ncbi:DUF5133 domain-containing protein [Streptomyces sp. NBC_00687]|uniref:DUF5133 domain-containing protein n=1 Tax=Streptomyces sp. NBC_00687 TaxID=2975807 RepID=UPI0022599E0B|nr:DUF5133 domain-containing protein [Streptomyces sp. NBC_00687]MCX4918960.1 DUF5133 domain-containing protein [Streptomyces sp. NBC_00687]
MLMPLPATLRQLVSEYEALIADEGDGTASARRRLADLSYTLCVSTGTRDITDALETARSYLAETEAAHPVAPRRALQRRTIPAVAKPSASTAFRKEGSEWYRDGRRPAAGPKVQPAAGAAQASR